MHGLCTCAYSVPVSMLAMAPTVTAAAAAAERPHKRHPPPNIHQPRVGSTFLFTFRLSLQLLRLRSAYSLEQFQPS